MEIQVWEGYVESEKYDTTWDASFQIPDENEFKLRIYKKSGVEKGNLDREEFFVTKEQMDTRYNELFVYDDYSLNPTAYQKVKNEWTRLAGY